MAALALLASLAALLLVDRACAALVGGRPVAGERTASRQPAATVRLASGACAALEPTGRARGRTVFLDPGHGGADPGVVGRTSSRATVEESATALAVAQEAARLLRADGYRVVLSRTRDSTVARFDTAEGAVLTAEQVRQDLVARVRCANASGAAALLSIHFNGYRDASASGAQTVYDGARPFAEESRRLAERVQEAVVAGLRVVDRGVVADDELEAPTLTQEGGSYGHLLLLGPARPGWLEEPTTMPGVLVEPLFLSSADAGLVATPDGQRRVAASLVAGLQRYLTQ